MKWNIWKADVAAELHAAVRPKFIVLHPMKIELWLSMDDNSAKILKAHTLFLKQIEQKCDKLTNDALNKMKTTFKHADQTAAGFTTDAFMASMFLRPIHMELEKYFDKACEDIQKEVQKLLEEKRKSTEALKKSAMKIGFDLKFDGIEIPIKSNNKKAPPGGNVKLPALEVDLGDIKLGEIKKASLELVTLGTQIKTGLEKLKANSGKSDSEDDSKDTKEAAAKLIEKHAEQMKAVTADWKSVSKPLKEAGDSLADWKKELASGKSKVPAEKKSALDKATKWPGWPRIQKTESQITLALKGQLSVKKYEEAQKLVGEGNSSWTGAVSAASSADKDLAQAIEALAKELETGGAQLSQIAKALNKK